MCDVKRPKSPTDATIREVEQEVMKNIGSDVLLHHSFYIMGPNGPQWGTWADIDIHLTWCI